MISIRKATNDLDRLAELLQTVTDTYSHAVRATGQYAIEMDRAEALRFREHLQGLQDQVRIAEVPEDWKAVQAAFRGELRDYRDKGLVQLERLRQDIQAASEAVQVFAQSMAAIDSDHDVQIKDALRQLEVTSQSVASEKLQKAIRSAATMIAESIEGLRHRHQAATVQLRDEIRLLHKQIDVEHNAQFLDPGTGVWNRGKLDSHVAELLGSDRPFCILLVCVRNLPQLRPRYSQTIIDGALKAFLQRFAGMLDKGAVIGRWNKQNFAAILEMDPAAAIGVSRTAAKKLAGSYSIQENGHSQTLSLQAFAGVIDRSAGGDDDSFQKKLLQMSDALAGG